MSRWLVFILILLVPATGFALGLGPITMRSALNQPLLAEIDIHSVQKGDLDGLVVKMASSEDFKRINVEKSGFLSRIQFKVITKKDGTPVIQLSTREAVTEPYLDFLIEARWPRGRALKEYTVLVDPPVLTAEAPAPVQQAKTAPVFTRKAQQQKPKRTATRRATAPRTSTQRFKPSKTEPAPKAEPAPPPSRPAPPPTVVAEAEPPSEGNMNYGKVRRNETLSEIAQQMRPSDVSLQRMMLALLRDNPQAFIGGNINRLKAGADLSIRDRESLYAISQTEAVAEVRRQTAEWRQSSMVRQVASSEAGEGENLDVADAGSAVADEDQARLKLVASGSKGVGTGGSSVEDDKEVTKLREDLILATEALDANQKESEELKGRLSELEEQLESMQRLINLKDQEMAALQSRLGEQPEVAAETPEAKQPTTETTQAAAQQPEPVDSGSFLSDETIIALGIFLVVAVIAWLVIRRKRMQEGFEESILNVGMHDDVMSSQDFATSASGFSQPQSVGSMASGFAVSDMTGIHAETNDVDPISEADVYLAYGRHQQAEDILKQALEKDDSRFDIHTKLLEVYNAENNQQAFETHAQVMHEKLGGDESNEHWQKVAAMGATLCPSNPLFGGSGEVSAMMSASAQDSLAQDVGGVTAEEEDLLDFDFEGDSELSLDSAAGVDDDDDNALDFDISSLDFNLDEEESNLAAETQQGSSTQLAFDNIDALDTSSSANEDNSIDFDMGSFGEDSSTAESSADEGLDFDGFDLDSTVDTDSPIELVESGSSELSLEQAGDEPIELSLDDDALALEEVEDFGEEDISGEFDEDIFANVDEIGSKLDLAKAYVDMGDSDGARSILDEVMEEGDDTQKEQAQQLLQQMG